MSRIYPPDVERPHLNSDTEVRLALALKYVSDGMTVTKLTGERRYTVQRSIENHGGVSFKAEKGVVWMIGQGDPLISINAVPEDLVVMVRCTCQEAIELLQELSEGPHQ